MIVVELRNKDQRIAWDVLNPVVFDFIYLGQRLTFQVKPNVPFLGTIVTYYINTSITYSLFEILV